MDLRNTVYMAGSIASHIRHMDKITLDDLYAVGLFPLNSRSIHICNEGFIYLYNNSVYPGKELLHQIGAPLVQSLLHNGMVGVVEYLLCRFKGFFKGEALVVHDLAGNRQGH